jgi:hypothetical protein
MLPIHARFNPRQLFSKSLTPCPLMLFGQKAAELRASLISFYEGVQKVPGPCGRPEARIIKRPPPPATAAAPPSEVSTRGHLSGGDTAGPTSGCRGRSRAGGWQTESWQVSCGQGCQRMNKRVCACNYLKQLPLIVHAMQRFQRRTKIGRRPLPPAQIQSMYCHHDALP